MGVVVGKGSSGLREAEPPDPAAFGSGVVVGDVSSGGRAPSPFGISPPELGVGTGVANASVPVVDDGDGDTGATASLPELAEGTSSFTDEHATARHRNNAAIKNFKTHSPDHVDSAPVT